MATQDDQLNSQQNRNSSYGYSYGRQNSYMPTANQKDEVALTPTVGQEAQRLVDWGVQGRQDYQSQGASDLARLSGIGQEMRNTGASQQSAAQALGEARGANMSRAAGNTLEAGQNYARTFNDLARGAGQAATQQQTAYNDLARGTALAGQQQQDAYGNLASGYGQASQDATMYGRQMQGDMRQMANAQSQTAGGYQQLGAGYGQLGAGYGQQAAQTAVGDTTVAGGQQAAIDRLRGWAEQGPAESAAQAQLRQAQDANMASAISMASSGRGVGGNALAARQAAFQNAATQQQTAQQAAVLRAQEEQAWRGQQLSAMGLEQQGLGEMRGQGQNMYSAQLGAAQGAYGQQLQAGQLGATYENLAQGYNLGGAQTAQNYAQLGQGYSAQQLAAQQAGTQAGLGYGQLGLSQQQTGTNAALQYANLGQNYRQMGANTELGFGAQAQGYNQLGQQTELGWGNLGQGYAQLGQQGQLSAEQLGATQGLGYSSLGQQAYQFGESGRQGVFQAQAGVDSGRAAQQLQRDQMNQQQSNMILGGIMSGAGAAGAALLSDERSKQKITDAESEIQRLHEVIGGMRKDVHGAEPPAPTGTMSYGNTATKSWMPYGYVDNGYEAPTGSMHAHLSPSSYEYRNPSAAGASAGTHYGPMAQELERTPAGRSTVIDTPQGKQVDTGRLAMATASEAGSLERRVQQLEALLQRGAQ